MNGHTKRRKRRRARAVLKHGPSAVRTHREPGGRTGGGTHARRPPGKATPYVAKDGEVVASLGLDCTYGPRQERRWFFHVNPAPADSVALLHVPEGDDPLDFVTSIGGRFVGEPFDYEAPLAAVREAPGYHVTKVSR